MSANWSGLETHSSLQLQTLHLQSYYFLMIEMTGLRNANKLHVHASQRNARGAFQYFVRESIFSVPGAGMSRVLPSFFWGSAQDPLALGKRHTRMPWMSHGLCPELNVMRRELSLPQPVKWFPLQFLCQSSNSVF